MKLARCLSALSIIGSAGLAPLLSSAVVTRPLIPGAVGEVQLPSSACVVRRNSIARARAAATAAGSIRSAAGPGLSSARPQTIDTLAPQTRNTATRADATAERQRTDCMRLLHE